MTKHILTDEEITEVMDRGDVVEGNRFLPFAYARAIEAAILEKIGEADWYHCVGTHKEHRFYDNVEEQPEGTTPLYTITFMGDE